MHSETASVWCGHSYTQVYISELLHWESWSNPCVEKWGCNCAHWLYSKRFFLRENRAVVQKDDILVSAETAPTQIKSDSRPKGVASSE